MGPIPEVERELAPGGLNQTHDPLRRSWVESANDPQSEFPIQNLPFGIFRSDVFAAPRAGVAIGDRILDLTAAREAGLFTGLAAEAAEAGSAPTLNALMGMPSAAICALRARISALLSTDGMDCSAVKRAGATLLVPMDSIEMCLPAAIGDYTDFSCSYTHMGGMRGGEPAATFFQFPIGYHGRASSIRPTGFPVRRPVGQWLSGGSPAADGRGGGPPLQIGYGPEPRLDFEFEFAAFVGRANALGVAMSVDQAADSIFGYCLLNDWSARGIQNLEMGGLGPFLGKSFLTTISPWVVTDEALAPFRTARPVRRPGDPQVPAHLDSGRDSKAGSLDIELAASLQTREMRASGIAEVRFVETNLLHLYWTFAQMIAHHTSNGCNLRPADLIASGTISGPEVRGRACFAEINQHGTTPLELPGSGRRMWLQDGDELTLRGRASRDGFVSVGFGECRGRVAAATTSPERRSLTDPRPRE
jgi:fumarylacetoacetase